MTILEFNALTKKSSRKLIALAISITITLPLLFLFILIYFDMLPDDPKKVKMIIVSFALILALLFIFGVRKIFPSKKYTLIFDKENITIKSNKSEVISYASIKYIIIKNNTDYSNISIKQLDNRELKLYVGFANLLNNKPILKNDNQLDNPLLNYFLKDISEVKGIKMITFSSINNID